MTNVRSVLTLVLAAIVVASVQPTAIFAATATPIPGGANQINGVSGGLDSTLFNGKVRIKKMQLRLATADEATVPAGGYALAFVYIVSNGTSASRAGSFSATIADADGVTINGHTTSVYSAYYGLEPGAAARGTLVFVFPDKTFVPAKILLTDGNGPAFRITLKASDIPAH
jgi:hypothetical protein